MADKDTHQKSLRNWFGADRGYSNLDTKLWYPRKFYFLFWGLERVLWHDFAGVAFKWLRKPSGVLQLFWTKKAAQKRADELNGA